MHDELHGFCGVFEHFTRCLAGAAEDDAHRDRPGEDPDVVGVVHRSERIVDDVENKARKHFADAARRRQAFVGRGKRNDRGPEEARDNRDCSGAEGRDHVEHKDGLDLRGFVGDAVVRNRAHDEHEDENGRNALEGRHENRAEEARVVRSFGRSPGKENAEDEADENLLHERGFEERSRKAEEGSE